MVAVGKSKEADAARCRRHPRHRHSAGVCPFCLHDRLYRLSAEVASAASPSSSGSSSPCSSTGEGTYSAASAQAPPVGRRARLGMLIRQEKQRETTTAVVAAAAVPGAGHDKEVAPEEKTTTKVAARRSGFWARLQQQLQHGSWHRKDGCSMEHSKAIGEKTAAAAPAKRAPALF